MEHLSCYILESVILILLCNLQLSFSALASKITVFLRNRSLANLRRCIQN